MHCWWNYSRMLGVTFGPRQTCSSCYYKASRSDLFPRYFCPADMLTLCGTLYISLLPMCVYSTYTQHSWSFLCKLFNKSGQRINTRQSNSEHQRSAACFFFFFFYLPVKNPLPLMAIMTGKWQIFQNGRSTYIPLIKISFRDKGSQTDSFCCHFGTFSVIYKNIWFCGSFLSLPFWCLLPYQC